MNRHRRSGCGLTLLTLHTAVLTATILVVAALTGPAVDPAGLATTAVDPAHAGDVDQLVAVLTVAGLGVHLYLSAALTPPRRPSTPIRTAASSHTGGPGSTTGRVPSARVQVSAVHPTGKTPAPLRWRGGAQTARCRAGAAPDPGSSGEVGPGRERSGGWPGLVRPPTVDQPAGATS